MTFKFVNGWLYQLGDLLRASDAALPVPPEALARLDLSEGSIHALSVISAAGQYEPIEIIHLQGTGGGYTLLRGAEGSAAQEWPAGALVMATVTAGVLAALTHDSVAERSAAGALLIDSAQARRWVVALLGDVSIELAPAAVGARVELLLIQPADGRCTVELPAVTWPAGQVEVEGWAAAHQVLTRAVGGWLGSASYYGGVTPGPDPEPELGQELFALWFYASPGSSLGIGPYLLIVDDAGAVVLGYRPGLPFNYNTSAAVCAVSADNAWAAAYIDGNSSPSLTVVNVQARSEVTLSVALQVYGPGRAGLQFADGLLYGWGDDGLFSVAPQTGDMTQHSVAVTTGLQAWSIADGVLAVNYNGTTAHAVNLPPVVLYDLVSGAELAEQLPFPAGGQVGIPAAAPPSPFGAVGAFSGDGSMYALCVNMQFGNDIDDSTSMTKLVIYDVPAREVLHTIDMPPILAYAGNVVWSRNSRYVAAAHDYAAGSAATVFDLQTQAAVTVGTQTVGNSTLLISNDGVLVVARDGQLEAYSAATGEVVGWPAWLGGMDETDGRGALRTVQAVASAWR